MLVRLALLAVSALAPIAAAQETRIERETWPDGSVRIEREVLVNEDGTTVAEGSYREFYDDGTPKAEGGYDGGVRRGPWRHYRPDGGLESEGSYARDLRAGSWVFYHPNGEKAEKGRYKRGVRSGKWFVWDEDGTENPRLTGEWEQERHEYPDGAVRMTVYRVEGMRQGELRTFWPGGEPQLVGEYRNGLRTGTWTLHHPGGAVSARILSGRYDGERRIGELEALPDEPNADLPWPPDELCGIAPPDPEGRAKDLEAFLALDSRAIGERFEPGGGGPPLVALDGPASLPTVLKVLRRRGCDTPGGRRAMRIAAGVVLPILCSGHGFGIPDENADPAHYRALFRDWSTLAWMTRDDLEFWLLDVPHSAAPERPDLVSELLRNPALLPTERPGGRPPLRDAEHFRHRFREVDVKKLGGNGTEEALAQALAWLAGQQRPDGSWSSDAFAKAHDEARVPELLRGHDLAVTALALLALMGDGNTPREGPYARHVTRGLSWVIGTRQEDGRHVYFFEKNGWRLSHGDWIYGHAMATLALAEGAALSGNAVLFEATQSAATFLCQARNPYSAWQYDFPPVGKNDTSVTSWAVHALHAARLAGAEVDADAFVGGLNWVDEVTDPATGRVGYDSMGTLSSRVTDINDHFPAEKAEAMTAAGLWMRLMLGADPAEEPIIGKHADLLARRLPEWDPDGYGCDMYAWYLGTNAMWQMGGGQHWNKWNKAMKKAVLDSQRKDGDYKGSWDPVGPWGYAGGRVYSTALMAMCLEVYTRYPRGPARKN